MDYARRVRVIDGDEDQLYKGYFWELLLRSKCTLYIGVEFSEEYTHAYGSQQKNAFKLHLDFGDSLVVNLKPGASNVFKAMVVDFSVFIAGLIACVGGLMLPYLMLYFAVLCAFTFILIVLFLKLY